MMNVQDQKMHKKSYKALLEIAKRCFHKVFVHYSKSTGTTTIMLYNRKGTICDIFVGQAYLSKEDNFNKSSGGLLALERAINAFKVSGGAITPRGLKNTTVLIGRDLDFRAFDYLDQLGVL